MPLRLGLDGRGFQGPRTGMENYAYHLYQALIPQLEPGEEVVVYTRPGPAELPRGAIRRELPAWPGPAFLRWALPRALKRDGVGLFHGPYHAISGSRVCPEVMTVHDLSFITHPRTRPWLGDWPTRLSFRRDLRAAAGVICVSASTGEELVRKVGIGRARLRVIHEGPGGGRPRPRAAEAATQGPFLFVGTVEPRKNLDTLLAAYASLRWRATTGQAPPELWIVGAAGWRSGRVLRRMERSAGVLWLGQVPPDRLDELYARARCLCSPSLLEGFGLIVVEALRRGLPVLAADIPVYREIAGSSARFLSPLDRMAWAQALEDAWLRPAGLEPYARAGLERSGAFSWERAAFETLELFRGLWYARRTWRRSSIS